MVGFKLKDIPLPGLRNIKTSIAVFACLIIYHLLGRDGVLLAAIAALICLQDSVDKSIQDGVNRIFGTMVGGIMGIIYLNISVLQVHFIVADFACAVGVCFLIYLGIIIHKKESIAIAVIVYLIVSMDTKVSEPLSYTFNRVLDTSVGIAIAIIVNRFFFNPSSERVLIKRKNKMDMGIKYKIKRAKEQKVSKWSGGTTTEIDIFPMESLYSERNFKYRISSATVDLDQSEFTKLKGFKRHIMPINGNMRLVHEGHRAVTLEEFQQDYFDGSFNTKSYGKCTDFNLMLAENFSGSLSLVYQNEMIGLTSEGFLSYYCIRDNILFAMYKNGELIYSETVNNGDYVKVEIENNSIDLFSVCFTIEQIESVVYGAPVIAIAVSVFGTLN